MNREFDESSADLLFAFRGCCTLIKLRIMAANKTPVFELRMIGASEWVEIRHVDDKDRIALISVLELHRLGVR